jgi:exopolysaccharide biosynthesis polyprenyl glycosylphosphotransferase
LSREGEIKQERRPGTAQRRERSGSRLRRRDASPSYDAAISPVWEAGNGVPNAAGPLDRDTILRRTLAGSDVIAGILALLFVLSPTFSSRPLNLRVYALLLVPFIVLAAKAIGLYDRDQHVLRKTTLDEVPSIIYLSVLYALTVWLAEALLFRGWLTRPQVFALALTSLGLTTAGRVIGRAVVTRLTPSERCLIVGDATDAARVVQKLEHSSGVNAVIIGRTALEFDERKQTGFSGHLGSRIGANDLAEVIAVHRVERVIIAPDNHDQEEILHAIRLIKAIGVKVSVLPRLLEVVGSSSTFEDVDGITLLGVRQYGASKSSEALKRVMDVVGASIGLLAFAPLLLFLAILIKFDSRGPVFFRQRRIGRSGNHFVMLKFRSMVKDADAIKGELRHRNEAEGGLFKITDDPRITRVGRLLRRTSLDELPQLLNVLGGSMSLVGPRPLVQDEDALIEGWQRRRLSVKPGMTGMWQIFGSSRIPMNEMVKIDYLYGANWSIWLDLKILLRTVPYVLRRRGL